MQNITHIRVNEHEHSLGEGGGGLEEHRKMNRHTQNKTFNKKRKNIEQKQALKTSTFLQKEQVV